MNNLNEMVRQEADNLKKFATTDEIDALDFSSLRPVDAKDCIYGQMTGDCFSERALELIKKCAVPYSQDVRELIYPSKSDFESDSEDRDNITAIEFYIVQKGSNNDGLIAYIKGETNTLEL